MELARHLHSETGDQVWEITYHEVTGLDGGHEGLGLALRLPAGLTLDGAPWLGCGITGGETSGSLDECLGGPLGLPARLALDGAPWLRRGLGGPLVLPAPLALDGAPWLRRGIAGLVDVGMGGIDQGLGLALGLPARLALDGAPRLGICDGGGFDRDRRDGENEWEREPHFELSIAVKGLETKLEGWVDGQLLC